MAEGRRRFGGKLAASMVGLAMVVGVLTVGSPAEATFPGTNGLIAYTRAGDFNVFVVNPSNPVPTQVTNTGGYDEVNFNAAGNKIVAEGPASLVLLDPVAGSAVTVIPNTTSADDAAAFNPAGDKVAFENGGEIFTIDVAGTNRTNIGGGPDADDPDWSADGSFIAFEGDGNNSIERISPTGGGRVVLATRGPGGAQLCTAFDCLEPTVSPDSTKVAFAQSGAGNGIAQVNADGSTVTPTRLSTAIADDDNASYSPDGTKVVYDRDDANISTVPTDGSTTSTSLIAIDVDDTSWAKATGTGTGTGTGGSVISVSAARNGANCVFSITATPAAAGITVDFSITSKKGVVKLTGNDVAVPTSPSIKAKKKGKNKVRIITLSDPKGATLGTASATCEK